MPESGTYFGQNQIHAENVRSPAGPAVAAPGPPGLARPTAGRKAIVLQIAATTPGDALAEPAARALNTIRQVMPARLRNRVSALQVTTVERPATRPAAAVGGDVLLALSAAVQARETLRFSYGSDDAGQPPRRAEPHHVITWGGRWYLIAWDLDRGDWRIFRADRITLRTPGGPRFTPRELPGGDLAAYVIGKFRGSDNGSGWPCQGTVILDLPTATVALYTRDGIVEEAGPGRCRLTLGSWSWPSLAAALARYDADIEVIGPAELTAAFAHLAERFTRTSSARPPSLADRYFRFRPAEGLRRVLLVRA